MQGRRVGLVQYGAERAKGRASCPFLSHPKVQKSVRVEPNASLWCTVAKTRGKCQQLQGKEIQRG